MTKWTVPQFETSVGPREAEAAAECIRSGWITEGPRCEEFIERVKKLAGVEYGVLAPNGTLALYLALKACGVGEGWGVVVPDMTFIATATAVLMTGATPLFADVNAYGQLSYTSARQMTAGYEPRVMSLPAHLYGSASNEVPGDHCAGLFAIEDACQALGIAYRGKPCGSLGKAAAFSFFADKTITTGEGGFVGTCEKDVYEHLRYLRNQGRVERGSFVHPKIGQNFRMTDIQAAVGLVQLDRMEEIVAKKRAIYSRYLDRLSTLVAILAPAPGSTHIPFRTVAFFDDARRAESFLRDRGIEPRSSFFPLHRQPCFQGTLIYPEGHLMHHWQHEEENFPEAVRFWNHALCLPTWADMKTEDVELVCDVVTEYCEERRRAS